MYCGSESLTTTSCVEPGYEQMTVGCDSPDELIATRSAFYARLPYSTPGFCERPTVDGGGRGDCVPQADVDRDQVAGSCNSYQSCVLSTYSNRHGVVAACSSVTGQVYINVEFDCLPRESVYVAINF